MKHWLSYDTVSDLLHGARIVCGANRSLRWRATWRLQQTGRGCCTRRPMRVRGCCWLQQRRCLCCTVDVLSTGAKRARCSWFVLNTNRDCTYIDNPAILVVTPCTTPGRRLCSVQSQSPTRRSVAEEYDAHDPKGCIAAAAMYHMLRVR